MAKAYVEIPLTKGKVALVDIEDAERVIAAGKWRAHYKTAAAWEQDKPYATLGVKAYMHRLILGVTDPKVHVDHINGNPLDNRRENLQIDTDGHNGHNRGAVSSNPLGYKGVTFYPSKGMYEARVTESRISPKSGRKNGGYRLWAEWFDNAEEAARAFDDAVRRLRPGNFNRFNFPRPGERGLDGQAV